MHFRGCLESQLETLPKAAFTNFRYFSQNSCQQRVAR
jgi:hypothetical protein